MNVSHFVSCLAVALFLGGCASHCCCERSAPPREPVVCASSDWDARLAAADAMSFPPDRDSAYSAVALDAARANRSDITKACVGRMSFPPARDQAASRAAMTLADLGNRQGAVEVATLMSFPPARDRTLKQIAAKP